MDLRTKFFYAHTYMVVFEIMRARSRTDATLSEHDMVQPCSAAPLDRPCDTYLDQKIFYVRTRFCIQDGATYKQKIYDEKARERPRTIACYNIHGPGADYGEPSL